MSLNALIAILQDIKTKYGNIECCMTVDTQDTFNFVETNNFEVEVENFKKKNFPEGISFFRVKIHTEIEQDED